MPHKINAKIIKETVKRIAKSHPVANLSELTSMDLFYANNDGYLDLFPKKKELLIEFEKKQMPKRCDSCIFFAWLHSTETNESKSQCAIKPELKVKVNYLGGVSPGCPLKEDLNGNSN